MLATAMHSCWLHESKSVRILLVVLVLVVRWATCCTDDPAPNPLNSKLFGGAIVCDEGYELHGGPSVPTCSRDGSWSFGQCLHRLALDPTQYNFSTMNKSSTVNGSCGATLFEQNPWIRFDLQGLFDVYRVDIEFGDATTSHDVEVRVGTNVMGSRNPLCAWETRFNSTFQCARPVNGVYVYLQLVGDGKLSICNASVYIDRDPLSACRGPTPSTHVTYNSNKCYTIHPTPVSTQPKALEHCAKTNSTLLTSTPLNLKAKLDTLKPSLGPKQLFWTSAARDPTFTSRTWRWSNNTVIRKPPWGPNQPNNYNGEQNCVVLDGMRDWLWNDVGCGLEFGYACEANADCGSPDGPGGAHMAVLGGKVVYHCVKEGYGIVEGDATRTCEANGEWSGTAPKCKFIDCGPFGATAIKNGSVLYNTTYYGSVVKYSCDEDHVLVGSTTRKCGIDGKWDGSSEAECLLSHCPNLTPPSNSTISTTGQSLGSTTIYKCNQGSVLIGSETRTCTLGGKWNGTEPECKYVECGSLTILNGDTKSGGGMLSDKRVVKCNVGYWLTGSEYTCSEDGSWSGNGKCEVITCPDPEVPPGSIVTGYEFKFGSTINYACEEGHLLIGPSTRRCDSEGSWTGRVPECKYVNCGYSPPPPHTQLQYPNSSTHLDSTIVYSCPPNYKLVGPRIRTCNVNGKWSGQEAHCAEIRCKAPSLPPHGVITSKGNDRPTYLHSMSYKHGALIRFHCERGYKVVGPKYNYTCNEDGNWTPSEFPTCEFVDCGDPPLLTNANYKLTSNTTVLASLLIYECEKGYKLRGRERHLCTEEGRWEPGLRDTSCEVITCPELETEFVKYIGNSRAILECPRGYVTTGKTVANCGSNGEWSELGYCLVRNCTDSINISNARLFTLNGSLGTSGLAHSHGAFVEVHCLPGYSRVGEFLLKCEDGRWSEPQPRCVSLTAKNSNAVDTSSSSSSSSPESNSSSSNVAITSSIISALLLLAVAFLLMYVWWRKRRRKLEGSSTRAPKPREEPMRVYYEPATEGVARPTSASAHIPASALAHVRPRGPAPTRPLAQPPAAPTVGNLQLQPHEHYYDNPEPVYEDVGLRQPMSSITINGVAV